MTKQTLTIEDRGDTLRVINEPGLPVVLQILEGDGNVAEVSLGGTEVTQLIGFLSGAVED